MKTAMSVLCFVLVAVESFALYVGQEVSLGMKMPDNTDAKGVRIVNRQNVGPEEIGAEGLVINGAAQNYGLPEAHLKVASNSIVRRSDADIYWLCALPAKYKIQNPDNTWREMTPEEKKIVDAPLIVTNVVYKPSAEQGVVAQEAEQIYVTLYSAFYHDTSYTNASYPIVAAQVASVAMTNDWWASRIALMKESFTVMESWWTYAKTQLETNQPSFHPYPWGQLWITNVVAKPK